MAFVQVAETDFHLDTSPMPSINMASTSLNPVAEPRYFHFSFASSYVSSQLAARKVLLHSETEPATGESNQALMKLDVDIEMVQTETQKVTETLKDIEEVQEGEDDDDYAMVLPTVKPAGTQAWSHSQKKRADYDAFDSWLVQNRDDINKSTKKVAASMDDEDKTSAALVREFESNKIIESPRDYQIELFEKAREKNIIAVLDTGLS